jgi:hypothetical protein
MSEPHVWHSLKTFKRRVMAAGIGEKRRQVKSGSKARRSQILRAQSGEPCDPGKHPWTDLLAIVKGEHHVRTAIPLKRAMRS